MWNPYSCFLFNAESEGNSGGGAEGVSSGTSDQGHSDSDDGKTEIPAHFRHFTHDVTRRAVRDAMREVVKREDFDSLKSMIESSFSKESGDDDDGGERPRSKKDGKGESDKLETPVETQMKKLQARLEALENEKNSLVESLSEKEKAMKEKELESRISDIAAKNNAISPAQVFRLIRESVIEDEEQGAVFEVQGQYGKEYKTPEEYIPEWLSQNKHFVKPINKSGSGSSVASSEEGGVINFTEAQLRDPEFYAKHRSEIHKEMERRRRQG